MVAAREGLDILADMSELAKAENPSNKMFDNISNFLSKDFEKEANWLEILSSTFAMENDATEAIGDDTTGVTGLGEEEP